MTDHPLRRIFEGGLPDMDVGVTSHCFAEHGRDYVFQLEDSISYTPGAYLLTFTHVVELDYRTGVGDEWWRKSWGDEFTDYVRWHAAGEPEGHVFGTNWSLAYPGMAAIDDDPRARSWSERLGHPMHAATIETDRFTLALVFHDARIEKIGDETPTVSQAIFPLTGKD